ncbi:FAD-binding protein [Paenarthrobacter sp. AR 02]|uniref:FAD-binding protein n=1 Tax=Paenarthrobacter sp. AR 02 TaxID=2899821 RepID=UPI001F290829|nr:FAD-binding protein [Paenarthrobacter sp. AR 02]MCF3139746.1 FAD-binding protein [Paenarthrobacter sp. AR 02]
MSLTPDSGTERTTTVVIGAGLSGLAVASELSRYGVGSIVVDGFGSLSTTGPSTHTGMLQRCDISDPAMQERSEILRHLRNYAANHQLDVRSTTRAVRLDFLGSDQLQQTGHVASAALRGRIVFGPLESTPRQWAVHTAQGVLLADHVVVTRCAQSQLRRMLAELGIAVGQNFAAAMRAVGMHLVGVGELITPTPKEVLRQAKAVGQAISAKVALPAGNGMAGSGVAIA